MQIGMLAIGVANPDRMMAGTRKRKAPKSPCCWVTASEEIINPTPMAESRKSPRPA